uniref:Uncharacterized protein n=1 Tax=Timema poppense TaxID=170557 RepID=A0A7R9CIP5_TIMPO|nr:unnamed protein product [Timema poppensis]
MKGIKEHGKQERSRFESQAGILRLFSYLFSRSGRRSLGVLLSQSWLKILSDSLFARDLSHSPVVQGFIAGTM